MFKVNEYFGGKVKSISFSTGDGPATAGVMAKGRYEFGTSQKEIMIVTTGLMKVKLPGSKEWKTFKPYDRFEVEAHQKFELEIGEDASYICLYR
ncbi:MAG TPA: pyrimidine/purine nucleoside phosphorylase [Syntrophales bacterium]|nr:pyrimidine/purine nucleoside phosphorylase [Syntrophales bacterium]HOX94637.1 pyrimidine/purine nucleoside phosphorylase [Syntrophales bacterium]HPI57126.1 pyrimidine/purine nucleoside phosphorylase [Syntrophales bacterium]HPN24787.1 pyrimidine/purine nucleoside phosphorylase [Syntrophales bacterium]HQM30074.1 pyrimidine/purine nucleoside phosphorylase [Syntrophales bacterium]